MVVGGRVAQRALIPVDTPVHKLASNLGWTREKLLSWRAAEEITAALRAFDAEDPVKYDFSLCHMGMLQRCPSRRDPRRCEGCGIQGVCRHWTSRPLQKPAPERAESRAARANPRD